MKRALVFLLFGPASVVLATWIWVGMPTGDFVINVAVALLLLTLPVSGIVGLMDRYLATVFPILVRAPLTTMAGATVAFVLPAALLGPMPQDMSLPFGALAHSAPACVRCSHRTIAAKRPAPATPAVPRHESFDAAAQCIVYSAAT